MLFAKLNDLSIGGKGSYGIAASAVERKADLPTYLRITDIFDDGTLNLSELKSVDAPNSDKYILKPNDIVFARTGGSTGRNYFYDGSDGVFVYAGFLIKFSIDPEKVNPKYVKYYCRSKQYNDWVQSFNTGSTRGNINAQTFGNMEIPLPERKQQDYLVSILEPIDEKIRNNKQVNDNLQQQAQAIYSSMFIDNPDPSWTHGHLSDLITVKYGKDHKKLADGIYPVYGSGGIMRYVERPLYNKESVLIPRKGTLNNVMYVNQPFWSVDTMFYTEMKLPNVAKFVYHFVKAKDLASMNAGSAVPSMTTDILNVMEVVIPSTSALEEFESLVAPMYEAMEANDVQSKALSQMRDTLLPKLMSGEIDVSAVQL